MDRLALATEVVGAQEVLGPQDQVGQDQLAVRVAHTVRAAAVMALLQMVVMAVLARSELSGPVTLEPSQAQT